MFSAPGGFPAFQSHEDFTGGEFVLTEQRPACSRAPRSCRWAGRCVVFAVRERPSRITRRLSREHAPRREPLRSGARFTLGIIFHDAK
jgi:hypothetical protein